MITKDVYEDALNGWGTVSIISSLFLIMVYLGRNVAVPPTFVYVFVIFMWIFSGLAYTFLTIVKGMIFNG